MPVSAIFSQVGSASFDGATLPLTTTIHAYDQTESPGAVAAFDTTGQSARARTSLGGNHAYASQLTAEEGKAVMAGSN